MPGSGSAPPRRRPSASRSARRSRVGLQRYHPVMVAQGFATLEAMYPGRTFVGIGSGESLNESPLGLDWPVAGRPARRARGGARADPPALGTASASTTRAGSSARSAPTCTPGRSDRRRSTSRPSIPGPRGSQAATATGSGRWATRSTVTEVLPPTTRAATRPAASPARSSSRRWSRGPPTTTTALEQARVWKGAAPPEYYVDDWFDPVAMYRARRAGDLRRGVRRGRPSSRPTPEVHVERIRELEALGATIVKLTNISGPTRSRAIRVYGEQVLPRLRG